MADKQANEFDLTIFNLQRLFLFIPPKGTSSIFDFIEKILNFCTPKKPFL